MSKAVVAGDRATWKARLGAHMTTHTCASPTCPDPAATITVADLVPVVTMRPHRHTLFFHRACAPAVSGLAGREHAAPTSAPRPLAGAR